MGVRGVFEIICETWLSHPQLCVKALQSFLDLLQGQAPSGLKYEPKEIAGKLILALLFLLGQLLIMFVVHFYLSQFFVQMLCMNYCHKWCQGVMMVTQCHHSYPVLLVLVCPVLWSDWGTPARCCQPFP